MAKAEIGKTAAEGEKIKEETKKTGTETKNIEQQIEESKTKVKDIIAGIPAKEQQYYVGKANQELMESTKELNETIKSLNKRNEKKYRDWETDRKSTRLNSSHRSLSRMPSSA